MAALPLTACVLCVHARADEDVPFRYSDRYVQAAVRAGGTAYLLETTGDHFTLIDPGSPDWQAVVGALPVLLGRGDGAELGDGAEP
jgi:hypothetical protein